MKTLCTQFLYFITEKIRKLTMRYGFGLNSDLLETNLLNLVVVIGVVVTVVGDSLSSILDQRRKIIVESLLEADQKAAEADKQLEEAQRAKRKAILTAKEIREKAVQTVENEYSLMKQQLIEDLKIIEDGRAQALELEYQRTMQIISQRAVNLALATSENVLIGLFGGQDTTLSQSKHKELNDVHVRETLLQLKLDR